MIVVSSRHVMAHGGTRYMLSNGWFVDRDQSRAHQAYGETYSAWAPGSSDKGFAAYLCGGNSLKEILAKLNTI